LAPFSRQEYLSGVSLPALFEPLDLVGVRVSSSLGAQSEILLCFPIEFVRFRLLPLRGVAALLCFPRFVAQGVGPSAAGSRFFFSPSPFPDHRRPCRISVPRRVRVLFGAGPLFLPPLRFALLIITAGFFNVDLPQRFGVWSPLHLLPEKRAGFLRDPESGLICFCLIFDNCRRARLPLPFPFLSWVARSAGVVFLAGVRELAKCFFF